MEDEMKEQGFDFIVTHRDPQSGVVTEQRPYTRIVTGEPRQVLLERPKQSGNIWNRKGQPSGRFVRDAKGKGKYDPDADHIAFVPERSESEKKDSRITELERELAAIKAEAAPKQAKSKATPADKV